MTKFDAFCDKMAALPFESKTAMINDLSKEIIPALNDLTEDGMIVPEEIAELAAYLIEHRSSGVIDEIQIHRANKEPFV